MRTDSAAQAAVKPPFFTRDKEFYKTLAHLMIVVVLQNVITYSVNMADNIMLGAYSQTALSGAAAANMIQFLFQTAVVQFAEGAVVLGSQYWAQNRPEPLRRFVWYAVWVNMILGILVMFAVILFPHEIISLFTNDEAIIEAGCEYLEIIRFTYPVYAVSMSLMAALRTVGTVNISFGVSIMSLLVNCGINFTLIFGNFGAPELGIKGASIGTITSRVCELLVLLIYILFIDKKLRLFKSNPFVIKKELLADYFKSTTPMVLSSLLWASATPIQTSILGHLSDDAIAANSASTTLYQYLKVITMGEASAALVITGRACGEGNIEKIKAYSRTLQVIFASIALVLGIALFFVRIPVLSLYSLNDTAMEMANNILIVLCFVMVGMGYQMPAGTGIIKGGGDAKFILFMNLISTWCIVMPLGALAAFVWNWPVTGVVIMLNADQIFKCIPVFIRTNRYKWIHHLTRKEPEAG